MSDRTWRQASTQPDLPALEREILARWRDLDVFAKSLEQRADAPLWTFYEGPPTANGQPGTHHVESRTFKDVFPRYRTMKGHLVHRKGGWDCHGLPVELEIERELGLDSKAEIEAFGIEEFNRRCRASVMRYVDSWEALTERIGFWVDLDDPYRTMDPEYVDSLWWAMKELWDHGLIFEDFRVTPYCGRCGTALSDAEVAQGYATVADPSVFVRFPITDGPLAARGAALIVWTTTPWTLPSNTGVAVHPDVTYVLAQRGDERVVVAEDLREAVLGEGTVVLDTFPGRDLSGIHYEPPFDFVAVEGGEDRHVVVTADYVTTSDGSGLVHMAPAFGAEDMDVGRRYGLPVVNPVDGEGRFTVGPLAGRFVKDADPDLVRLLDESGRLLKAETYEHTYPFCWRCKRPLIYYAKPSWYIRTTARRDQLLENNAKIDWHPEHIREGRFGNWLENNVDWALSRDRYWGTPLPFWRCTDCDDVTVVASRAELGELGGRDLSDLDPHRPYVDAITLSCDCGGTKHRVPDVADAWFDSGGMPYAQWGYPHRGQEQFERHFPAQFICEAIDQTRGWFYTLLAESTLLFGTSSYETVLCLGHIVDEDGQKMSKSKGNVLDPWELIERHGADALRWLMLAEGNPWVNRRVGHSVLEEITRRFLLTLWNTHVFFLTYARIDGFELTTPPPPVSERPASDRWVLAELADVIDVVDGALGRYDVSAATRRLERFVDDLSNWYVRRNRRRFWKAAEDDPQDKAAAYHTLHTALSRLAGLLAPFTPFIADRLWTDLVATQDPDAASSVHLTDFPVARSEWRDEALRAAMATARRITELGRQARNDSGVKVRQPLARALVTVPAGEREAVTPLLPDVADELNVHEVVLSDGTGELVERTVKPNFRALGPVFQKDSPKIGEALRSLQPDAADRLARELDARGAADIAVADGTVTVTAEMVEVVETPRTGWALAREGAYSFALDTELTDHLLLEGAARELVRAINDLRKGAGLALEDRIEALVDAPEDVDRRLDDAGLYDLVARETLATRLHRQPVTDGTTVELGDLGTARVEIVA